MKKTESALRKLPREYFYEIETKYTDATPKNIAGILCVPLFFNIFAIYVSSYSYQDNPVLFYFASIATAATLILIVLNLLLKNSYINPPKTIRNLKVLFISTVCVLFFSIPMLMAVYQEKYLPIGIVLSPLLLIPIASFMTIKMIHYFVKNIFNGCALKGGTGIVTKKFIEKYWLPVVALAAVLEGSRLRIIIWSRFTGELLGMIMISTVCFFLTIIFCALVATAYMRIIYYRLFPNWGSYYKKSNN